MKVLNMFFWGVVLVMILLMLLLIKCFSILGPFNKPYFEKKNWSHLSVQYYIKIQNGEVARTIAIEGVCLDDLKQEFLTKSSRGVSVPNPGYLLLTLSNGETWKINFSIPQRLNFCRLDDNYYSYRVELRNINFYNKLREKCYNNELADIPDIKLENISICTGGLGTIKEHTKPYCGEFSQHLIYELKTKKPEVKNGDGFDEEPHQEQKLM